MTGQKLSDRNFRKIQMKIIYILLVVVLCGCKPNVTKWEYHTEVIESDSKQVLEMKAKLKEKYPELDCYQPDGGERFGRSAIGDVDFNKLGAEGWELVSIVPQTETVWPMLKDYSGHLSKQPNTRTRQLIFFFKRPASR